jgi:hypothetical protein
VIGHEINPPLSEGGNDDYRKEWIWVHTHFSYINLAWMELFEKFYKIFKYLWPKIPGVQYFLGYYQTIEMTTRGSTLEII